MVDPIPLLLGNNTVLLGETQRAPSVPPNWLETRWLLLRTALEDNDFRELERPRPGPLRLRAQERA